MCCGRNNHIFSECKYKTYRCNICSKVGHFGYNCRKKYYKINYLKNVDNGNSVCKEDFIELFNRFYHVGKSEQSTVINRILVEPIKVKVEIKGKKISLEFDTGASVSIISESQYDKNFNYKKLELMD